MRTVKTLLIALVCLLPLLSHAKEWNADNFPIAYLQDSRCYVSDPDNVLSPAARDTIDVLLADLEAKHGVQSLFAVAKKIEGGDPYEFGMALARKYGIGSKKQNSGLIVVLSTDDRAYYILTGNGLEGTLPDAICKRIENQYMVPYLKNNDWDTAMTNCAKAVYARISGDSSLLPAEKDEGDDTAAEIAALVIVAVLAFMFYYLIRNKNTKTCPKCHKHTLKRTSQNLRRTADGKMLTIYKCTNCGYTEAREENDHNDDDGGCASALLPFLFMGGGRSGGFGGDGGGFSGGSFGGGSFGGGGAGGKF